MTEMEVVRGGRLRKERGLAAQGNGLEREREMDVERVGCGPVGGEESRERERGSLAREQLRGQARWRRASASSPTMGLPWQVKPA